MFWVPVRASGRYFACFWDPGMKSAPECVPTDTKPRIHAALEYDEDVVELCC